MVHSEIAMVKQMKKWNSSIRFVKGDDNKKTLLLKFKIS